MLSKTAWVLTKTNNNLVGRAVKAKYGNFLNSFNRTYPSPIWKGLQWCKDTIQENQEISTKPSRESKAATRSISGTKKETHPHRLCSSTHRKNPHVRLKRHKRGCIVEQQHLIPIKSSTTSVQPSSTLMVQDLTRK
ncbi:hypothetical protein CRG98_041564 [Punica granatum]|uniref:Uncharacterized protein n=1 Tax=Punica granatum TaxID=22663 RepID=A0A2I0I211_PUNGR|nr:hypothetical protein CRG98_041564 [Punica granatum]